MTRITDIKKWVDDAIAQFNAAERLTLLGPRTDEKGDYIRARPAWGAASERAIAHRLATYIEQAIGKGIIESEGLSVDCEYNRHLGGSKVHMIPEELVKIVENAKRDAKSVSDDDSFYVFSIAPDIIVHRRGDDERNVLVVELKKDSNAEIPEYDRLKLRCFTGRPPGYRYLLGAKVTARDLVEPAKRELEVTEWYVGGDEVPEEEL
jgi:hypothetical protein